MAKYYFDKYPEICEEPMSLGYDGEALRERLQKRYEYIIKPIENLKGNALTLGGYNGRIPLALLDFMDHVTTIESIYFHQCETNLAKYKKPEQYTVIPEDFFHALPKITENINVLVMAGVYYHISSHQHLINLVCSLNPELIILDSVFLKGDKLRIDFNKGKYGLQGQATVSLTKMFFKNCGYSMKQIYWDEKDYKSSSLKDYKTGRRKTFHCTKLERN
jgi:hypothetical protein